ncbi:MAG: Hsp70 family protein [bacterium]|nr:Hsp70 family protein [bacterium]
MSAPIAYGIDYGTTNSSIAVAYSHGVEVLELDSSAPLPSALPSISYLHRDGLLLAGAEAVEQFAITGDQRTKCHRCSLVNRVRVGRGKWESQTYCRQYAVGSGCLDSRLMGELKNELSNERFRKTHSWAQDYDMEDLCAIIIADLKRRADQHTGRDVNRAVVGYPVAFFGTAGERFDHLQEVAEGRLREAVYRAGFSEVELFPEPAAAALDEVLDDGYAVAVDFGGGTFDVAVIKIREGEGEVVSMEGAAVGGAIFDQLIFERKVAPLLGLDKSYVPAWFKKGLASWGKFRHLLTNPQTFIVLHELQRKNRKMGDLVNAIVREGQAFRFYKAIENAKIALSRVERSSIEFHPPQGDLSIPLRRSEVGEMVSPYLRTVESQIIRALQGAGITAGQVSIVLRTGGSSHLVAFVGMLNRLFGAEKIREREAFTTVAYGLGIVAQETWI